MAELDAEVYYDSRSLEEEMERTAQTCHSCQLCFDLCPTFPALFSRMEAEDAKSPADSLTTALDLCYQCQLCALKCPYTPPRGGDIDLPLLARRWRGAQGSGRSSSPPLEDLIEPGRRAKVLKPVAPLAKWASGASGGYRHTRRDWHPDAPLPRLHQIPFSQWWALHPKRKEAPERPRVALFFTCWLEHYDPDVAIAAVEVLERHEVGVTCPSQRCCGAPLLEAGDIEGARELMRHNATALYHSVREGREVLVPGPICSFTIKEEYPRWLPSKEARLVADHTWNLSEYLMKPYREGRLDRRFLQGAGHVAYHPPSHLKAQQTGAKSIELLELLPNTSVTVVDRSCGMRGPWGFTKENYPKVQRASMRLVESIQAVKPDYIATECPLAAMFLRQETKVNTLHPIQLLRRAYEEPPAWTFSDPTDR